MIKHYIKILFLLFIFLNSVLYTEYFNVFKAPEKISYLVYQPNIGINQQQFDLVIQRFSFKKVTNSLKKIDYEYRLLPKLNDNHFIRVITNKCSKNKLDLGSYPSKLILIKRYKKYDYAIVSFSFPLADIAECLLSEFNNQIREQKLAYIDKELKPLYSLVKKEERNDIKTTLINKISLLKSLRLLYSSDYKTYNFLITSPYSSEDSTLKLSFIFALLIMIIFLLITRLFKLRNF